MAENHYQWLTSLGPAAEPLLSLKKPALDMNLAKFCCLEHSLSGEETVMAVGSHHQLKPDSSGFPAPYQPASRCGYDTQTSLLFNAHIRGRLNGSPVGTLPISSTAIG